MNPRIEMKKRLLSTVFLALLALSTSACPRRVEVESEPNPEYSRQLPAESEASAPRDR